jgi:RNA polymerase sigma-70 factor (ECF subfamily)
MPTSRIAPAERLARNLPSCMLCTTMADENASGKSAPSLAKPEQWVAEYGDYLFAFALSRVRDAVRAEDLVQETFFAALKASFAGASPERSWLTGILKHKIMDYYRTAGRERTFTDLEFPRNESQEAFAPDGHWAGGHEPSEWPNPAAEIERAEFRQAFLRCAEKLPKAVAQVFIMREVDDVESREICEILKISPNNLWVMLHRARMGLRRCLEVNWFEKKEK